MPSCSSAMARFRRGTGACNRRAAKMRISRPTLGLHAQLLLGYDAVQALHRRLQQASSKNEDLTAHPRTSRPAAPRL